MASSILASWSGALALAALMALVAFGLLPARRLDARPRAARNAACLLAWLAFAGAASVAAAVALHGPLAARWLSLPLPGGIGAFSLSFHVDALSAVMLVLVSFIGAMVARFSRHYLDGDVRQGRFFKWLLLTLASILLLVSAGNLLLLALAWTATSLCLHQLLVFYPDRPAALMAAHKKFVFSRLGDAALLGATALVGSRFGTLEIAELLPLLSSPGTGSVPALQAAAFLVVLAAVLKSAQFPFHGWLVQVMEAPTPVSALLHAGIVNAGGFLVIRLAPLVAAVPGALDALVITGATTAVLAGAVMMTQNTVKGMLAWSTCAQMGFMLMECGLGAFTLAVLHIVAHSLYKAHAFLASGSVVDAARAPVVPVGTVTVTPLRAGLALGAAGALTLSTGFVFGEWLHATPTVAVLGALLVMALTHGLVLASPDLHRGGWARVAAGAVVVAAGWFAGHALFDALLAGPALPQPALDAHGIARLAPVAALFTALLWLHLRWPVLSRRPRWQAAYVHLHNGLYIDLLLTRLVERAWPAPRAAVRAA